MEKEVPKTQGFRASRTILTRWQSSRQINRTGSAVYQCSLKNTWQGKYWTIVKKGPARKSGPDSLNNQRIRYAQEIDWSTCPQAPRNLRGGRSRGGPANYLSVPNRKAPGHRDLYQRTEDARSPGYTMSQRCGPGGPNGKHPTERKWNGNSPK